MATSWLIWVERPIKSTMDMVVEMPGIEPHRSPRMVPRMQMNTRYGLQARMSCSMKNTAYPEPGSGMRKP